MRHKTLCVWNARIHAYCLEKGVAVTPAEAARLFGAPTHNTASGLLHSAAVAGYFRRESTGATKVGRGGCYRAIDKKAEATPMMREQSGSYFRNLKRCRSVFELGGTL